ncbi:hypothetical protein KUL72_22080 [Bradyrhizobium arachidis]|uniref:hypothetical protein n=1 Tax=Bradyrhizobium TaxID=374 RepID=UPI00188B267E|nr:MULTISPECIES: hypothetical protein [Bradyrhizobium]MDN4982703.1 hypothetical protein [Bradyrhizobium sp. WYCCWR 13022]QOZ53651.1 hypothetical protein XH90_21490 [Bradyrhizobium sp. CCBAU 53338]UVO34190.1 hypothetical protein KUL72_22080 [Bradyrhizobium arachidis]
MRRTSRLIAAAVLIAFTGLLGGCSSGGFDPSDLLDFLDTKKKLPGERKPVFPEGVPGLEQGVPKEMYKGAQQQQDAPDVATLPAEPPPAEPAKSSKSAKGKKARQPAPTAEAPAGEVDGEAQPEAAPAPAAPPPKHKIVRKRTTAPPPDQQSAQPAQPAQTTQQQQTPGAFPAPLPSGTFSR